MWIVHAGNRIDPPGRADPRFPAANVSLVEERLRRLLSDLRPTGVVSSAASGADLLALSSACDLRIPVRVVLPLPLDIFVEQSVADQGGDWVERFWRVVASAVAVTIVDLSARDDWYLRGNDVILDEPTGAAGEEPLLAIAVRPVQGRPPLAPPMTSPPKPPPAASR